MAFGGKGTTLFDHDKTVILVGETVNAAARAALGEAVAEWQQSGRLPGPGGSR
jgi:hypothetical protein